MIYVYFFRFNNDDEKELSMNGIIDYSQIKIDPNFNFNNVTKDEIANQITLINFNIFKQINPRECISQSWKMKNKEEIAPNILKMINQFNQIIKFIQLKILQEKTLKNRIKSISKIIKICDKLLKIENYYAFAAVLNALLSSPIDRLEYVWKNINKNNIKLLETFKIVFS